MRSPQQLVASSARLGVKAFRAYQWRLPRVRVDRALVTRDPTVYFLTPSLDEPAGGVRVAYRHVDILNSVGIDAAVLHSRRGFRCTWFEHDTRVTDVTAARLGMNDLLVAPELYAAALPALPPGLRHLVFNQNPHVTFRWHRARAARYYATSSYLLGLLTVSDHGAALLRHAFPHLDVARVRLGLDPTLFHPPETPAGRVVTYMPRRGRDDATLVLEILHSRGALEDWQLRPLEGLSQRETADALRRSSIFLSFTYQEGFGLPAAEAMACGNLVVGFDGFSGAEFFGPAFSCPVPTGDVLALARSVEHAIHEERRNPGWLRAHGLRASKHIQSTYSLDAESRDVSRYFARALGQPDRADSWPAAAGGEETVRIATSSSSGRLRLGGRLATSGIGSSASRAVALARESNGLRPALPSRRSSFS